MDYQRSSLPNYQSGRGPTWLVRERVLKAFELSKDGRGRRAYVRYLEKRADEQKGELSQEATVALRKGWYLGDETFRDKLLALVEKGSKRLRAKGSHQPEIIRSLGEKKTERIAAFGIALFDLESSKREEKERIKKGDARRVVIATVLKKRTTAGNSWIAEQLQMGHDRAVSRLIKHGKEDSNVKKLVRKLEKCCHASSNRRGPILSGSKSERAANPCGCNDLVKRTDSQSAPLLKKMLPCED